MTITRRNFLAASSAAMAAGAAGRAAAQDAPPPNRIRIATEEAFATQEQFDAMKAMVDADPTNETHAYNLWRMITSGDYGDNSSTPARLLDLEEERLRIMDANGVTMHLLSLTSPGVQMLAPDVGTGVAADANDQLRDLIARHPTRFAGLAAVAPQAPEQAAREIERAVGQLGLNGVVINSHTNDEYLDEEKYWPILEAAEAMNAPIYIHPRSAPSYMRPAFARYNMDTAFWGYGVDAATHAVRLIMSGVFDRFPNLRIVLGHMGEGVHFWFYRLDRMSGPAVQRGVSPITLKPSEYFIRNFRITTSGQESDAALRYSIETLGIDNVMWAIDYPYQDTREAVDWMDRAPVTEDEREALYHRNAARIFNITTLGEG